jgi:hypothetical protein
VAVRFLAGPAEFTGSLSACSFALAVALLQAADKLILLSGDYVEVIVRELTPTFSFTLRFSSFHLPFIVVEFMAFSAR